jgi:hypothetical protein
MDSDMHIGIHIGMHAGMYIGMHIDTCISICYHHGIHASVASWRPSASQERTGAVGVAPRITPAPARDGGRTQRATHGERCMKSEARRTGAVAEEGVKDVAVEEEEHNE